MELDELKNTWLSLDERLRKQEILKESIVREMMHSKADKSLNRLSNFEWWGLVITIIVLPLPLLMFKEHFSIVQKILTIIFSIALLYAFISQIWKIYELTKVDLSKPISNNIKILNKFNIYIKKERMTGYIAFPLVLIFFAETIRVSPNASISPERIVLLIIFLGIAIAFSIWQYMKFYKRNINSILKSLDELKELEEE